MQQELPGLPYVPRMLVWPASGAAGLKRRPDAALLDVFVNLVTHGVFNWLSAVRGPLSSVAAKPAALLSDR